MTTITASSTIGVNLAFYTSPVVVGAGVTISNPNYPDAVYTSPSATILFSIQNEGTIAGSTDGIYLAPGRYVLNDGRIVGTTGFGVYLASGGSITNATSASITGDVGVKISGVYGTVVNNGSITGTGVQLGSGPPQVAIYLAAGGLITNATSGSIAGSGGVFINNGSGTVVNDGSIAGTNDGVDLDGGGSVTNATSGLVTGHRYNGVSIFRYGGTVVNYGRIVGGTVSGNDGVLINLVGGSVTNAASGTIVGSGFGIIIHSAGFVLNYGTIVDTGTDKSNYTGAVNGCGIELDSGGSVTNATSASIIGSIFGAQIGGLGTLTNAGTLTGNTGAALFAGGTVTNAGTIIGNAGTAVMFGGTVSNRLVLDPGFYFSGLVIGSSSASNVLELASAASVETLTGLGTELLHFGSIVLDAGAKWSVTGLQRGLAGPISGFAVGDTIELTGVTATGSSYAGGVLTLDEMSGFATLDLPGTFVTSDFVVTNVAGGANVSLACFVEGTRIRTDHGAVAVEALRVGDRVPVVMGGKLQPIIWLGHRRVECRHHPQPTDVWPVCLAAGAFGPGRPFRDLWLSPDHALFVNGVLIPVRYLVNDRTIYQEPRDAVTYWHIELAEHNVLYAEGVPAESYLDTGNRSAFVNGGAVMDLHADFARQVWEARGCVSLVVSGPRLVAAKQRLLVRARALGHMTTDEANLRVLVDGKRPRIAKRGQTWCVGLRKGARNVRLTSRVWRPAHTQPDTDDLRTLGVAISRLWLDGSEVALDSPAFVSGWHEREQDWRWTDGDASLVVAGARELTFEVGLSGCYWLERECEEALAA